MQDINWLSVHVHSRHLLVFSTCIFRTLPGYLYKCIQDISLLSIHIQSTLVISNFTGPDKNVRVISSSRQPNCDVIGTCMTTVRLCSPKRGWKAHVYGNLNNIRVLQFALLLFVLGDAIVLLE